MMNKQSFSFGHNLTQTSPQAITNGQTKVNQNPLYDHHTTKAASSAKQSDSVDSIVDDQAPSNTEDCGRPGSLSPLDNLDSTTLQAFKSRFHSQMTNYLQQQLLSSTEERFNQLLRQSNDKSLGIQESKAVFGNTRLILDGDNSKVIQEKRVKQRAQLEREVQIGMYLKEMQEEQRIYDRIKCLYQNDFENYRRRYVDS